MGKMTPSQFRSKMRQLEQKQRQAISNYNNEVRRYNQKVNQQVNAYNTAVRKHNAEVQRNRSRIQQALNTLSRSHTSSSMVYVTYRTSVQAQTIAYQSVSEFYDQATSMTEAQENFFGYVEREQANNLATAQILNDEETDEFFDSIATNKIAIKLNAISADANERWVGALYSLNPRNPDASRHFCTSARELFTMLIDTAKDIDVLSQFPSCELTPERGTPTRKSKIKFLLHKKGYATDVLADFIEKDIANIISLFGVLSDGTHSSAGKFAPDKLAAVKVRVEDGLEFLCELIA